MIGCQPARRSSKNTKNKIDILTAREELPNDMVFFYSWVPALLAPGFASGFVHYLLDRSVFKMSEPQVRAAAAGLLKRKNDGR